MFFILYPVSLAPFFVFFFFNDPAPPQIYTLSLHDALPISRLKTELPWRRVSLVALMNFLITPATFGRDRKSTRLNSSHVAISYAVFCLKKKKKKKPLFYLVSNLHVVQYARLLFISYYLAHI